MLNISGKVPGTPSEATQREKPYPQGKTTGTENEKKKGKGKEMRARERMEDQKGHKYWWTPQKKTYFLTPALLYYSFTELISPGTNWALHLPPSPLPRQPTSVTLLLFSHS